MSDDGKQSVRLSLTSTRCPRTSSFLAENADLASAPSRAGDVEVLEKIKRRDGDAFRSGDDSVFYPPMPKTDEVAQRRALIPIHRYEHFTRRIA